MPAETFDDLIEELRGIEQLRAKGKTKQSFYFRSRPFLHFHSGPDGVYADVRFADDWERMPATTPSERNALVALVREHVTG